MKVPILLAASLLLGACTSGQFLGVGSVPQPKAHEPYGGAQVADCVVDGVAVGPVPTLIVTSRCQTAVLIGMGYASSGIPSHCVAQAWGWGIFIAECVPLPIPAPPMAQPKHH